MPTASEAQANQESCATVAAWVGVAFLTIVSAGVTFFLVCSAAMGVEVMLPPSTFGRGEESIGPAILGMLCPAAVAAVLVGILIIVAFRHMRRR